MGIGAVLLFTILPAGPFVAQDLTRPSPEGGKPTRVELGIYVIDLWQIDGARQAFSADLMINARWVDSRLRHEGPGPRSMDLARIWHPRLQVVNGRDLKSVGPLRLEVDPQGAVSYTERLTGELSTTLNLADFPFDRQKLPVTLVSLYTLRDVEIVVLKDRSGRARTLTIPDWSMGTGEASPGEFEQDATRERFQALTFELVAVRRFGYYAWKVYLPLLFIVMMSWTVFWMDPGKLSGSQVSISVTSMLTLTTYRFSLGTEVPKVSYLTRFDLLFTVATAFVFLALVEVVGAILLEARGKAAVARRMDVCARWGFPAGLIASALLIHWV